MIQVTVALASGRSESFSILQSSKVGDLKALVQKSFGHRFSRLVTSNAEALTDLQSLKDGDHVTAVVGRAQLASNPVAFVLCCDGERVIPWGHPSFGGGISYMVQDQLRGCTQVQSTNDAFAAIREDGLVFAWGRPECGGDSSAVQDQLKSAKQLQATSKAFAAILEDGSIVTWGNPACGGDSSSVQDQLRNVQQVQANRGAFAAILKDGSIVTWGRPECGGDSPAVQDQLRCVTQVQATDRAFAAILEGGSVVTWGFPKYGGDSSSVQGQLKNVKQIQAAPSAFAAIVEDGSIVSWGHEGFGGNSSAVQDQLRNVQQVQATTGGAFAAILEDGSVVSWGHQGCGGNSSAVQDRLKRVKQVQATSVAFAAILEDGSVVAWGGRECGGDSSVVQDQLKSVQQVQATQYALAAILQDGSIVSWGAEGFGGNSSAVQDQLRNVQQVQSTGGAFAAILEDGSVVTWGRAMHGGDSSTVQHQMKNGGSEHSANEEVCRWALSALSELLRCEKMADELGKPLGRGCECDFPPLFSTLKLLTSPPHGRYSFLDLISFAMQRHPHAAQVQACGLAFLGRFCLKSDAGSVAAVDKAARGLVFNAMEAHLGAVEVQACGGSALGAFVLRGGHQRSMAESRAPQLLLEAMRQHGSNATVQEKAANALRLVVQSDGLVALRLGAAEVLVSAMTLHLNADRVLSACLATLQSLTQPPGTAAETFGFALLAPKTPTECGLNRHGDKGYDIPEYPGYDDVISHAATAVRLAAAALDAATAPKTVTLAAAVLSHAAETAEKAVPGKVGKQLLRVIKLHPQNRMLQERAWEAPWVSGRA
eukprot:s17_g44.t1